MSAAERRRPVALGGRDPGHDGVEEGLDPLARLGRDVQDVVVGEAEHPLDLGRAALGLGGRQVDLVEHRHDFQVVLHSLVAVGQRLGLDPLGGVDEEDRPLAGRQRPRDLVAEVHVPGGVDQVQDVVGIQDADVLRLDRDPPLPLDVHRVEVLLSHEPGVDGARQLQDAVRQRRLAMVDVADDREVADPVGGDRAGPGNGCHGATIVPAPSRATGPPRPIPLRLGLRRRPR